MADIEVQYDLDITEEQLQGKLHSIGNLLAQEMRSLALRMGLKDTGDYSQGFLVTVSGSTILIENRMKYAKSLEFGTYEFGARYSEKTFPDSPFPKKKDIDKKAASAFPRGMQPWAIMRRVLYNRELVMRIIKQVFSQ